MNLHELSPDELLVFSTLQSNGPGTKKQLEASLGRTPSTTNRIIQSLLRKGAIREVGQEESTGGRRPSVFDIQSEGSCLLGLHISQAYVRMVLCDLKLRILEQETLLIPPAREEPETVLEAVGKTFSAFLARRGLSRETVLGAGLGMFGPVDRETGVSGQLMDYDRPIRSWSGIPIRDMLQDKLGIPVCVDAACNAGALAEYCCGDGRSNRSIAYFLCEIGFSVGQISSGRILRRWDGRYDGFSHVSIDRNGELCPCGKRGCVHLYASVRAIIRSIRRQAESAPSPLSVPLDQANFGHVAEAAAAGNEIANAALAEAGSCFGYALSDYLNLLNPDDVVIDGALGESVSFCRSCQDTLLRCNGEELNRHIRFRQLGSFGAMTVAVGAAALCYESLLESPVLSWPVPFSPK